MGKAFSSSLIALAATQSCGYFYPPALKIHRAMQGAPGHLWADHSPHSLPLATGCQLPGLAKPQGFYRVLSVQMAGARLRVSTHSARVGLGPQFQLLIQLGLSATREPLPPGTRQMLIHQNRLPVSRMFRGSGGLRLEQTMKTKIHASLF